MKPATMSGNLWREVCALDAEKLRRYLDTETGYNPFTWAKWDAFTDKHGIEAFDAIIEDRLEYVEAQDRAAALCFQRAEETRRKNAPKPVNGEDHED